MLGRESDITLIPPADVVRAELARSVRESQRLRTLLRVAVQNEDDRRYVEALRHRAGASTYQGEEVAR
jgi:hypothetical protein